MFVLVVGEGRDCRLPRTRSEDSSGLAAELASYDCWDGIALTKSPCGGAGLGVTLTLFDVSEMSLSSYLLTLEQPEPPFVALPVFPSRFLRHQSIYVNANNGIAEPKDLIGKRVGTPEIAACWLLHGSHPSWGYEIRVEGGHSRTRQHRQRRAAAGRSLGR